MRSKPKPFFVSFCVVGIYLFLSVALLYAGSGGPRLIAELRHIEIATSQPGPNLPPDTMAFAIGYDLSGHEWPNLGIHIGAAVLFPPGEPGRYAVYDALNSPDFDDFVTRVTNGQDELMFKCGRAVDVNGDYTLPGTCSGGRESGYIDGASKGRDLTGADIDFIRLHVNKLELSADPTEYAADWDVTWQFWSGSRHYSGGGQRTDVNGFLTYQNPLQNRISLPAESENYGVVITYGATIDLSTFSATLNGEPFYGFNPLPGISETVTLPLIPGRNVLLLTVEGVRTDGNTATDRDRFTFIVE
ncbi:hypothetical protein ACFLU6_07350 [Acidobacteriota bacterium]